MSLPSSVAFAAGDKTYIAALNQLIADINVLYTAFLATTAPAGFVGSSSSSVLVGTGSKTFTLAEAGARVTRLDGSPDLFRQPYTLVAAPMGVHEEFRAALDSV